MITITPAIADGMKQQVQRANKHDDPSTLRQRIAELEAEIRRLQTLLQQRDNLLSSQTAEQGVRPSAITAGGRELITPSQAARAHGCSVATINRALNGWGNYHLDGIQLPNGRWMVYADSFLKRPNRRNRKGTQ